jgi:hypothetical protein
VASLDAGCTVAKSHASDENAFFESSEVSFNAEIDNGVRSRKVLNSCLSVMSIDNK